MKKLKYINEVGNYDKKHDSGLDEENMKKMAEVIQQRLNLLIINIVISV